MYPSQLGGRAGALPLEVVGPGADTEFMKGGGGGHYILNAAEAVHRGA